MADTKTAPHDEDLGHAGDAEEQFYDSVSSRYRGEDAKRVAEEDGVEPEAEQDAETGDGEDEEGTAAGGAESDDAEEQAEADTSDDDRDGDAAESDEDSEEGEESDQTDEESEDDADDEDADAGDEKDEEDEEGEPSDELREAAARHRIPLTVEDIKDPTARKVVAQKLASMDAGFTRAMQEARAFRKEQAQVRADQKYRSDNPELAVVELLQEQIRKDPQFLDKINARLDKLEDTEQAEAFKIIVGKKRDDAREAVERQMGDLDRRLTRASEVEKVARRTAAELGLPWRFAERAVVQALNGKPEDTRDLTDDEIKKVIRDEHREYDREVRSVTRAESKRRVAEKTASRKSAAPARKAPASATAPRPKPAKEKAYDDNDEEQRIERMMQTARRVMPGRRDK